MLGRFKRPLKVARGLPFRMPAGRGAHALTVTHGPWKQLVGVLLIALALPPVAVPLLDDPISRDVHPLVLYGICLSLVAVGLAWLLFRLDVSITGGTVEVARRGLFGTRRFAEPLAAYRGVRHRHYRTWEPAWPVLLRFIRTFLMQRLELEHPDPARTVPLMQARSDDMPREDMEAYAKAFGLPAIQDDGGRLVVRAAEDLDRPLADLARDGKVEGAEGPSRPPPRSLRVRPGDDRIEIDVRRPPLPSWVVVPAFVLFGLFCFRVLAPEPFGALVIARTAALAVGGFVVSRLAWRRLVLFRDRIEWHVIGLLGPKPPVSLLFRDIETVTLAKGGRFRRWRVRIAGDRHTLDLAQGLKRRDLEWLRDYMMFAVAKA